jgi:hypothetical protein
MRARIADQSDSSCSSNRMALTYVRTRADAERASRPNSGNEKIAIAISKYK